MLGVSVLICPNASHNQAPRLTFQNNQIKQAIGTPTLNREFRTDRHAFYAETCELPLVRTIIDKLIYPNGLNEIMAIMARGCNQEDSLEINHTAANRGFFRSTEENYIKITLEQNEKFGRIKSTSFLNANYSKIKNGFHVEKFTIIQTNDVIICKYIDNKGELKDTSEIYRESEDIIILDIIYTTTLDNKESYKIKYCISRTQSVGCKSSTRHGQKGSISRSINQSMLPFTQNGMAPDKIINTSAFPARMTIGQMIEGLASKYCMLTGQTIDATIFNTINIERLHDELEKLGYDGWGDEEVYDGDTGHPIGRIFITPIRSQSLPKYGNTEIRANSSDGPVSIVTKQPLEGRKIEGGLRIGEMEKDRLTGAGAINHIMEKFREDSDDTYIYICTKCHKMATAVNEQQNHEICNFCKSDASEFVAAHTSWTSKNFIQHNESSYIGIKLYEKEIEI